MSSGSGGTALATRFGLTRVNEADWKIDASWVLPAKDVEEFDRTISGSLERGTPLRAVALTTTSVMSLTTAAVERASADLSELTDHLLHISKATWVVPDHAKILRMLREWTALKASDLAVALNVSRRAIYFWTNGGPISPENQARLNLVVNEVRPLARLLPPDRMRVWLSSGELRPIDLLQRQEFENFRKLAERVTEQRAILVLPSRLAQEDDSADDQIVRPLTRLQSQSALMAFSRSRQTIETAPWTPPEISDSPEEDD